MLPLADNPNQEVKVRCVVRPEPAPAMLLERLPLRLRIPTGLEREILTPVSLAAVQRVVHRLDDDGDVHRRTRPHSGWAL